MTRIAVATGANWCHLPMPRLFHLGPRRWQPTIEQLQEEWFDDVRELVCERLSDQTWAMWADPRERWR